MHIAQKKLNELHTVFKVAQKLEVQLEKKEEKERQRAAAASVSPPSPPPPPPSATPPGKSSSSSQDKHYVLKLCHRLENASLAA